MSRIGDNAPGSGLFLQPDQQSNGLITNHKPIVAWISLDSRGCDGQSRRLSELAQEEMTKPKKPEVTMEYRAIVRCQSLKYLLLQDVVWGGHFKPGGCVVRGVT